MATTGNNAIHSHDIMSSEDDRPRRARIYSDVTDLATLPGHEKAVRHSLVRCLALVTAVAGCSCLLIKPAIPTLFDLVHISRPDCCLRAPILRFSTPAWKLVELGGHAGPSKPQVKN